MELPRSNATQRRRDRESPRFERSPTSGARCRAISSTASAVTDQADQVPSRCAGADDPEDPLGHRADQVRAHAGVRVIGTGGHAGRDCSRISRDQVGTARRGRASASRSISARSALREAAGNDSARLAIRGGVPESGVSSQECYPDPSLRTGPSPCSEQALRGERRAVREAPGASPTRPPPRPRRGPRRCRSRSRCRRGCGAGRRRRARRSSRRSAITSGCST